MELSSEATTFFSGDAWSAVAETVRFFLLHAFTRNVELGAFRLNIFRDIVAVTTIGAECSAKIVHVLYCVYAIFFSSALDQQSSLF